MNRTLSIAMLHATFLSALRTTAMVVLVVTCAYVLNFSLSLAGIPQALSEYIGELGWSPIATIWALVIFYLILGCFLEIGRASCRERVCKYVLLLVVAESLYKTRINIHD